MGAITGLDGFAHFGFWIADLGFETQEEHLLNPKSQIQNPKSLHFPPWLREPLPEDGFCRLAFECVAAIVLAALLGRPFPDAEAAQMGVAPPALEKSFV